MRMERTDKQDREPKTKTWRIAQLGSWLLVLSVLLFAAWFALPSTAQHLVYVTGGEGRVQQLRGLWNLALDATRPSLQLATDVKVDNLPPNQFGANVFLEQEVEVSKREKSLQMLRDAGITWLRQSFVWSDIEIHSKGDFEDRRNEPHRSAWVKYDNIVTLTQHYSMTVIARLGAPPKWAHAGYADLGDVGPPAKFEDFADFVGTVVQRYKGRIHYYQIWNEPNIYPEWGKQRANPEDYAKLLCMAYDRAKSIDPNVVILAAALAPTVAQDGGGYPGGGLNDLIFLQRMYKAGAGKCFDVAAAQGYGLFSGPYDQRTNPLQTNVARHVLMRDIMVRSGDAHKPIWLSEVNWNAVPNKPNEIADVGRFGMSTLGEQARYVPMLYDRAKLEWPWVGVVSVWFFKRPSDAEKNQSWYYFRMVEPDFTPLPLYTALKDYTGKMRR